MSPPRPPLSRRRLLLWCGLFGLLLGVALLLGASLGATSVSALDLVLRPRALSDVERTLLVELRLPRVLLAALVGGALAVAGVAFQALLRNPLADPFVLGVAGGASLGGVVALLAGLGRVGGEWGGLGVAGAGFLGALAALATIERLATTGGQLSVYTLLLTGAIFNAFSAALIFFLQSIASAEELHAIVFQLMGQVPALGWRSLSFLAVAVVAVAAVLWRQGREFNALSLGEEGARQLGVRVEATKRLTFVLGSLLTALAVSVAGLIGFVGLIVPHLLRLVAGPDHRLLLPLAFLGGAAFLVLADLVARIALAPNELPVGVVTALLGGPFFLLLLRRRARSERS